MRLCSTDGCDRKHKARGLCGSHYQRLYVHGRIAEVERTLALPGTGTVNAAGYRVHWDPSHPAANPSGSVYEHRRVLYDQVGPGSHPCRWCGTSVAWDDPYPRGLVVDHIDHNRLNNDPSNLAVSCRTCNGRRNQHDLADSATA